MLLGLGVLHTAVSTECSVACQLHDDVQNIVCSDKIFTFLSIELTSDKR